MNMDEMDLKWENMRAGIDAQVPFVREGTRASFQQVRERISQVPDPSRVYLVGCGDSWYCGMATRYAFEAWTGLSTEAPQAMEFSRYGIEYAPAGSLVVATSNSGRVARTVECVARAKGRGFSTVALTGHLQSAIAQVADVAVDLAYAERRFAPGTSSYMASLVTLYTVALALGERNGHLSTDAVQAKLEEMAGLADAMQATLAAIDAPLAQLAQQVPTDAVICFMGAGPNYGTAFFSMAKMIEAARHNTVGQQLEEWAHEQYFVTGPNSYTFVLAPRGAGLDRAREQLYAIRAVGGTAIAVCAPDDEETQALADLSLPVPGSPDELLTPLLYCLAGEVFSLHFAQAKSLTMLGFDDEQRKQVNFQQIFDSRIVS